MASSVTSKETARPSGADGIIGSVLPSLKGDMPKAAPPNAMRRATSEEFERVCKRDDMLFLRLGQGTSGIGAGRARGRDYLRLRGMTDECPTQEYEDDRAETQSIAETEIYEGEESCARLPNSVRMFPSLSPQPMEGPQHYKREVQLGSSQRDVYDVSPPPGYKRLKRVRVPDRVPDVDVDEDMTITAAMNQLLSPPEGHISRLQRSRRRRISVSKRQSQAASTYHHPHSPSKLLPMGDGFSGDETQPQKDKAGMRVTRARAARAMAKKAKRSCKRSDSSGSNQNRSYFQHAFVDNSFNAKAGRKRKGKGDRAASILGSLDIVSLSQEDIEAAKVAATVAVKSAAKSKDIARHVIPLRPTPESPGRKRARLWSLGLDELILPEERVQAQEGRDGGSDMGEAVFDAEGSVVADGDVIEVARLEEAETTLSVLPPLRRH